VEIRVLSTKTVQKTRRWPLSWW